MQLARGLRGLLSEPVVEVEMRACNSVVHCHHKREPLSSDIDISYKPYSLINPSAVDIACYSHIW